MDCDHGHWEEETWEDDHGRIHTSREWISACKLIFLTTLKDKCTVCEKVFVYGWLDDKDIQDE
ncbi:hypothetical protein UFOVP132_3 [uncultured Caudovirales phage]|uniref:Uncharacterized protein n=1 Tax=uncultured Caudovirales phage TaxID=2100421 RepID=A0A6J5L9H8_9CAUD|nr:hypothetical protein UFOVP132_3 [uncultured Caudovirales phage]